MKDTNPIRSSFTFKQFHVAHDQCAMKVGTDAILLGAWAPIDGIARALDIGTGSGILSLMLAQRARGKIHIDALDIDPSAVAQAQENIEQSPWPNNIHSHLSSLQNYHDVPYDLLISNPPYFRAGQILQTPPRQWARHAEKLPHDQLLSNASRLSHARSSLALVLPSEIAKELIQKAPKTGWHLNAYCTVYPTPNKPANRQLLLFDRTASSHIQKTELTIRQTDGSYSPVFTRLCQDFYLKM